MDLSWSATATPSANGNVFLKPFDVEKYDTLFAAFTSLDGSEKRNTKAQRTTLYSEVNLPFRRRNATIRNMLMRCRQMLITESFLVSYPSIFTLKKTPSWIFSRLWKPKTILRQHFRNG